MNTGCPTKRSSPSLDSRRTLSCPSITAPSPSEPGRLRIHLDAAPEATRVYPSVLEHEPDLVAISVLSRWRLGSRGPEGWRDLPSVCRNSETRSSRPRPAAFPVGFCLMRPWRGLSLSEGSTPGGCCTWQKKRRLEVRGKPETQPPPPRLLLRVSPERLPRARDRWGGGGLAPAKPLSIR